MPLILISMSEDRFKTIEFEVAELPTIEQWCKVGTNSPAIIALPNAEFLHIGADVLAKSIIQVIP